MRYGWVWVLAAVVGCGGGESGEVCAELGEMCHEAGEAAGEGSAAQECHEFGEDEANTDDDCEAKMAECEEACAPAA